MTSQGFPGLTSQSISDFYLSAEVVGQCGTQFLVCLCWFVQVRTSFRICSFKHVLFCQGILSSTSMLAAENTKRQTIKLGSWGRALSGGSFPTASRFLQAYSAGPKGPQSQHYFSEQGYDVYI